MDRRLVTIIICIVASIAYIAVIVYKRKQFSTFTEQQKEAAIVGDLKSTVRTGLYAGIGFLFLCAVICGFMCFNLYKEDGDFAFRDITVDLNEAIKNGNEPEAGEYVSATFSLVGESFYSDDGSTVFYPVVLKDSGEKPCVIGMRRDIEGNNVIETLNYINASKDYIKDGKDTSELPEIYVKGRYVVISYNLPAYQSSTDNSDMTLQNYNIKNTCVDITVSKDKLKHDIVVLFIFFVVAVVADIALIITTVIIHKHLK